MAKKQVGEIHHSKAVATRPQGPGVRPGKTRSDVSVGSLLRTAREHRRLTLDDVVTELHIPRKHLIALEQGNLSVFTAEIYAHGAFTKYASFLDVQADHTHHAFMRVLSGAREFVPLRVHTPRPWLHAMFTPHWILAAALSFVATILGGYIAWQVNSFFRLPGLTLAEPSAGVSETQNITVRGTAGGDADITVNGEQVLLNQDGLFSYDLVLRKGVNTIRVEATNGAGRTRTITRDVLVPRQ